jgi:hypothetical protein
MQFLALALRLAEHTVSTQKDSESPCGSEEPIKYFLIGEYANSMGLSKTDAQLSSIADEV